MNSAAVNNDKHFMIIDGDSNCTTSSQQQPQQISGGNANTGNSNHHFTQKNSLRGTKLARRARSFKEDIIEKIAQIRTPTNTLGRSHSPNSPRTKTGKTSIDDVTIQPKPIHDLNYHVRQVMHALTHFKDVISKKKLEMLHGNGTVVLESIANIHAALQSYTLNEHSSSLISATQQVHFSLGKLIKLCDEVLLSENEENSALLNNTNVTEVVELVENAVKNLVKVANEKLSERDAAAIAAKTITPITVLGSTSTPINNYSSSVHNNSNNSLQRPIIDVVGQRTSLPDIPLTPRERDILEQSSNKCIRTSHSTESVLRDSSPPPKPPLPNRCSNPPPLPPKRKSQHKINQNDSDYGIDSSLLTCGLDRMSLRSRSPDDNSSLLSASSLDSALNHSREEDEIRAITMEPYIVEEPNNKQDIDKFFEKNSISKGDINDSTTAPVFSITEYELRNPRISNESGFASMNSLRASLQSTSTTSGIVKRLSENQQQQQHQKHHHSSNIHASKCSSTIVNNDTIAYNILPSSISSQENFMQQNHQHQITTFSSTNSSISSSCSTQVAISSSSSSSITNNDNICQISSSIITTSSSSSSTLTTASSSTTTAAATTTTNMGILPVSNSIFNSGSGIESVSTGEGNDDNIIQTNQQQTTAQTDVQEQRHLSGVSADSIDLAFGIDNIFTSGLTLRAKDSNEEKTCTDEPPALPVKTRTRSGSRRERHMSTYDNVEETDTFTNAQILKSFNENHITIGFGLQNKHRSFIESRRVNHFNSGEKTPPLPPKKKHIMAYMEMFGNCSHSTQQTSEFLRHSVHTYNVSHHHSSVDHLSSFNHPQNISHSQTMSLSPLRKQTICETSVFDSPLVLTNSTGGNIVLPISTIEIDENPPALPPKRQRSNSNKSSSISHTPPSSPKLQTSVTAVMSIAVPSLSSQINNNIQVPTIQSTVSSSSSIPTALTNQDVIQQPATQCYDSKLNYSSQSQNSDSLPVNEKLITHKISMDSGNIDRNSDDTSDNQYIHLYDGHVTVMNKDDQHHRPDSSKQQIMGNLTTFKHNTTNRTSHNSPLTVSCTPTTVSTFVTTTTDTTTTTANTATTEIPAIDSTSLTTNPSIILKSVTISPPIIPVINNKFQVKNNNDNNDNDEDVEVVLRHAPQNNQQDDQSSLPKTPSNLIEELDISMFLVLKKQNEEGPDVKGGYLDALIVHASKVAKVSESAFGEAFITTFRTFISPLELIEKLTHRYEVFCCQINDLKQKAAKESFSLLVRVVNDLTAPDLTPTHLSQLNEFVYQLVCSGQLMMAKLLRNKILEKIMIFKQQKNIAINPVLSSRAVITSPPTLLDLKSADIAAQMTLLDSELFNKIEIPEVLIWAQEQCEERSPNLTRFTEHFNKMSYWARSQILKQEDAKDREKHVIKFIKIMKHLRKINNYNSYLALLSALDSAPIRRLEWHKTITEGLKEYCALIDSSSSFRAYRQALAETNPPCIPYIGLVLQDLTFVHIGNQDYLHGGMINFSKRWQQFNIVVNMKRFKQSSLYSFKKNERIISFFDNFENYLDEDAMWQISENIKPRISRKIIPNQQQLQQQQQQQQQQQLS